MRITGDAGGEARACREAVVKKGARRVGSPSLRPGSGWRRAEKKAERSPGP